LIIYEEFAMKKIKVGDKPLTESKFFHYMATAMSAIIILLMGWIGANVSDIPVIKNQMTALASAVSQEGWIAKKLDDHENRIRAMESKR
jgi:hypothetical protein